MEDHLNAIVVGIAQNLFIEAHGFLFFKGAPLINRTVFKWEEVLLAHYTDALITITEEDYVAAQKFRLRSGRKPYLVHGAGVQVGVTVDIDRAEKRKSIGVAENDFVILSAGELNKNKNTEVAVRATMMSFREGLPRAILEAMDSGLPCVGSDTRGIRDLIGDDGGFICKPTDANAFASAFNTLKAHPEMCRELGERNREKAKAYSYEIVRQELYRIYKEVLK